LNPSSYAPGSATVGVDGTVAAKTVHGHWPTLTATDAGVAWMLPLSSIARALIVSGPKTVGVQL
jgi:hypothetical protein